MSPSKTTTNSALQVCGVGKVAIEEAPIDLSSPLPAGHVLLRTRATGICGSDIHFWESGGRIGNLVFSKPFTLGHECAGEVLRVGDGVTALREGARVAIKPGSSCKSCVDCTSGQFNLCETASYYGTPGADGSCCTFRIVPQEQLVPLTPKISWTKAGLIQPLAIVLHMARRAGLKAHQNVMILGGGCVGLLFGAVAKAYGAAMVVVLEKQTHRAEFAKQYCADHVFVNPPREVGEQTLAYSRRVGREIIEGVPGLRRGFDVCIEAAGAEECMQMGLILCRPGGCYVQVGISLAETAQIPMMELVLKQIDVRGTCRYSTNCFEEAVLMIDRQMVDVESLVSHTYQFEDSEEAFTTVKNYVDREGKKAMKVVILHDDHGKDAAQPPVTAK